MVVLFVDLKAAFDSVDRKILVRMMRGRGLTEDIYIDVYADDMVLLAKN